MTHTAPSGQNQAPSRIDERELAAAKLRVSLVAMVGAEINLQRAGAEYKARCPFHKEKTGSFYVYPDGHFHCFGCGAHGDQISWLMQRRGMSFREAAEFIMGRAGGPATFERRFRESADAYAEAGYRHEDKDERERRQHALEIWQQGQPIAGTVAERYLRRRAITIPLRQECFRFHPKLWHGRSGKFWPALIASIVDRYQIIRAVQRTFLTDDGVKAPIDPNKRTKGAMHDGAVRLAKAGRVLGLAEGTETGLSAMQLYTLPVWAALGSTRMRSIWLPPIVEEVMLFRDNGEAGFKWAVEAAKTFEDQGRHVMIEPPPVQFGDWNDVLMARKG